MSSAQNRRRTQAQSKSDSAGSLAEYHKRRRRKQEIKILGIGALAVVLLAGLAYVISQSSGGSASIGSVAPDFTLTDSNGNSFSMSQFNGRPVVLFFMTTSDWCQLCKIETRDGLVPLNSNFGSKIQIISIEMLPNDRSNADLNAYKTTYSSSWLYARDTSNVYPKYAVTSLSTVVIVDQQGVIRFRGADPTYDAMANLLRDLGV